MATDDGGQGASLTEPGLGGLTKLEQQESTYLDIEFQYCRYRLDSTFILTLYGRIFINTEKSGCLLGYTDTNGTHKLGVCMCQVCTSAEHQLHLTSDLVIAHAPLAFKLSPSSSFHSFSF